jgi:molybdate transport system substrate-binding protein
MAGLKSRGLGWAAVAAILFGGCAPAAAAEIRMVSAMALHATWLELMPGYEKASGDKVTIIWSPGLDVEGKVESGEKADVAVLAAAGVDDLIRKGFLAEGSRVPLVNSLIGIATRPGAPRPDIATAAGFRRSLLNAKSIALSAGTSSIYLRKLFDRMGIGKEMEAKLYKAPDGRNQNVANVLRRGDADLGFQQVSELIDEKGIDLVGPIPRDLQEITVWSAGLYRDAREPDRAKALVQFIKSPEAAAVIHKHGLEQVQ